MEALGCLLLSSARDQLPRTDFLCRDIFRHGPLLRMPGLHGRESVKQEGYGWLSSQGANADEYAGAGEGSLLLVGMGLLEIKGPHGQELAL